MSGAARRRGRGRARGQGDTADGSEPLSIPAGGFDGPASRGSGSGTSGNRIPSQSSGTARAPSPTASGGATATATPPQRLVDPALDPSRIPKASDALKNVDLPASLFQGLDRPVSPILFVQSFIPYTTTSPSQRMLPDFFVPARLAMNETWSGQPWEELLMWPPFLGWSGLDTHHFNHACLERISLPCWEKLICPSSQYVETSQELSFSCWQGCPAPCG
jgi:hypothetical protein